MRPGGEGGSSLKDLLSVGIVTGIIQSGVGGEICGCLFSCSLAQRAWNSTHSCTNNNMTNSENTLKFNGETSLFISSSFALLFLSFLYFSYFFFLKKLSDIITLHVAV